MFQMMSAPRQGARCDGVTVVVMVRYLSYITSFLVSRRKIRNVRHNRHFVTPIHEVLRLSRAVINNTAGDYT